MSNLKNNPINIKDLSPKMKRFLDELRVFGNEYGLDVDQMITSAFREGDAKRHGKGEAVDLKPDNTLFAFLWHSKKGIDLMSKYDLGLLDERTEEVMQRTGATGPHFHIGWDTTIPKATDRKVELDKAPENYMNSDQLNTLKLGSAYYSDNNVKKDLRKWKLQEDPNMLDYDEKKQSSIKERAVLEAKLKEYKKIKNNYQPGSEKYKEAKREAVKAIKDLDLSITPLKSAIATKKLAEAKETLKSGLKITNPEYRKAKAYVDGFSQPDFLNTKDIEMELGKTFPRNYIEYFDNSLKLIDDDYSKIFTEPEISALDFKKEQDKRKADYDALAGRVAPISEQTPEGDPTVKKDETKKEDKTPEVKTETKKALTQEEIDTQADEVFNSYFKKEEMIVPDAFEYDKRDYAQQFPIEAIGQGALGLIGLSQADEELPLRTDEISEAILNFARENAKLSKMGLRPEEESAMKSDLADVYQQGINQLVRASGGNRNLVLGNLSSLNANQIKGLNKIALADIEAKDRAFQRYGSTLEVIQNFNTNKDITNHNIKLQEAQQKRQAGAQLAQSGFSNMLEEIQHQKENGPGSINHMYKASMFYNLFGQVPGMEDKGQPGSESYNLKRQNKIKESNVKANRYNDARESAMQAWSGLSPEVQAQHAKDGTIESFVKSKIATTEQSPFIDAFKPKEIPLPDLTVEPFSQFKNL